MAIKASLDREDFQLNPPALRLGLLKQGFLELPIHVNHVLAVQQLPWIHRDSFDRLLVAQAAEERLSLLTADRTLLGYGEVVRWVGRGSGVVLYAVYTRQHPSSVDPAVESLAMSSSLSSAASSSPSAGAMLRTQIYLSEAERQGLQALAMCTGRSQSALIREAIDAFLEQQQPQGRLGRLRQARGLWAERTDLPDWSALRGELDRTMVALEP